MLGNYLLVWLSYFSFLFFHLKLNNLDKKRRLGCLVSVFSNILIIGIRIIIGAFEKRSGLEPVPAGVFCSWWYKILNVRQLLQEMDRIKLPWLVKVESTRYWMDTNVVHAPASEWFTAAPDMLTDSWCVGKDGTATPEWALSFFNLRRI